MNRKLIAIFGALLFLSVGVTIAFNSDSMLLPNVFHPATTKTSVVETFVAPTDWLPCQTADKVITVRNDGNVPVAARIKIAESWKDKDGNELALTFTDTNGTTQRLALININTADWEKRGAYYYYKTDLASGETSTPFITDVALNCAANLVGTPYLGGTYTLSATIQTIEAEHQNEWPNIGAVLADGPTVNAKLKALAGTNLGNNPVNATDRAIKTIKRAAALPQDFDTASQTHIISAEGSAPIYAWFDNTNNAGVIYIYADSAIIKTGSDVSRMFQYMTSLVDAPAIASWDTSNATSLRAMFQGDTSLVSAAVAHWDTSNVTDMAGAFNLCESLTSVDVSGWDTSNVTSMYALFAGCESLTSIDVSDWDTPNVANMSFMFWHDKSLASIDVSGLETQNVANMSHMFQGCKSLTSIDVSSWGTTNVTDMSSMFSVGDSHLGNGQLSEIIGLENWDASNVTNMTAMFYGAGQMTHYNISGWNVSKVEGMQHMFCDNFMLESLDLSGWNMSSVKTIYDMFDDARSLTTLGDISHWSTANLIDAGGFLNGATSFVGDNGALDLSGWDTSNLLAAGEMFRETPLTTIDIRGWDFSKLTNDSWEGAGSGIYYETGNTSSYPGLSGMFLNMPNLQNAYIDQGGKDTFDAAVARGVNVTKFWQGSPISDFTILSN